MASVSPKFPSESSFFNWFLLIVWTRIFVLNYPFVIVCPLSFIISFFSLHFCFSSGNLRIRICCSHRTNVLKKTSSILDLDYIFNIFWYHWCVCSVIPQSCCSEKCWSGHTTEQSRRGQLLLCKSCNESMLKLCFFGSNLWIKDVHARIANTPSKMHEGSLAHCMAATQVWLSGQI